MRIVLGFYGGEGLTVLGFYGGEGPTVLGFYGGEGPTGACGALNCHSNITRPELPHRLYSL